MFIDDKFLQAWIFLKPLLKFRSIC